MKWFRLYAEARNDAKLRSLTDAQHRVWFNLLCYASEMEERGCIHAVDRELLAVECASADIDLLDETITRLVKLRIVTVEQENVCFVNFMKRQYDKPSDTPERVAGRVSRHRAKGETPSQPQNTPQGESETRSNADVTPAKRAYSDTDTEHTQTKKDPPNPQVGERAAGFYFDTFWQAYPRKDDKDKGRKAWARLNADESLLEKIVAALEKQKHSEQWQRGIIPLPATWLNGRRWEDESMPARTSAARTGSMSASQTVAAFDDPISRALSGQSHQG